MKQINLILALDSENGLGKNNTLAWRIKKDIQFFKEKTLKCSDGKKNALIMGRKTWESIPTKFKPLSGRLNCIISRSYDSSKIQYSDDLTVKTSNIELLIKGLEINTEIQDIFVIGGSQIYSEFIKLGVIGNIYLTKIHGDYGCDVFIDDEFLEGFDLVTESPIYKEGEHEFKFLKYKNRLA